MLGQTPRTRPLDLDGARELHIELRDVLTILGQSCADLLDLESCSIVGLDGAGGFVAMAATSEVAHQLAALQLHEHEGPTWECLNEGVAREVTGLLEPHLHRSQFAQAAARAHICAVYAVPLRSNGTVLGALTLYLRRPMSAASLQPTAIAIAHGASRAIELDQAMQRADEVSAQLSKAINGRVWIEQAKGLLGEQLGVTPEEAFRLIRSHARRAQRKTSDIGRDLVAGSMTAADLAPPPAVEGSRRSRRRSFSGTPRPPRS